MKKTIKLSFIILYFCLLSCNKSDDFLIISRKEWSALPGNYDKIFSYKDSLTEILKAIKMLNVSYFSEMK